LVPSLPDDARLKLRVRFIQVVFMTPQGPILSADDVDGDQ
jgi:hypothetical protein